MYTRYDNNVSKLIILIYLIDQEMIPLELSLDIFLLKKCFNFPFSEKKINILPPLHNRTQKTTLGGMNASASQDHETLYLTHVKNSTVTVILRTRHNRTRKPEKTNYWKNRDRVTPTYAMALPLGLKGKTKKIKPNNMNTNRKRDAT